MEMKKLLPIILLVILLSISLLSGCTTQNTIPTNTENNPLFIITDTGTTGNTLYVDIQNIDTKSIRCHVSFDLKYIDEESVGDGYDTGGSTGGTGPSGIYEESHLVYRDIEPHKTERISYTVHDYSGYMFVSWDYDTSSEFI